jgi:hypothetical protein
VLLFDPIAVPNEILALAAERDPVIVLTAPWHERDARDLAERLGAPVYAPPADTAEDLMQKFGITAERAGEGSPDLGWLRSGSAEARWYAAGDRLPVGIEAFQGREHNDLVLWMESSRAVEQPRRRRRRLARRLRRRHRDPAGVAAQGGDARAGRRRAAAAPRAAGGSRAARTRSTDRPCRA